MKKAVIVSGSRQFIVSEGDEISVDVLEVGAKELNFDPLLIIDNAKVSVGRPVVTGVKVSAEVTEGDVAGDKVLAIRYKSKKRVHKVRGHRQHSTTLKIVKIA